MQKLNVTLEMAVLSSDDQEKQSELQALLCGVLQVSYICCSSVVC